MTLLGKPTVRALAVSAGALALLSGTASAGGGGGGDAAALGSDSPSWSPDGQLVTFVGFRLGRAGDIYVTSSGGTGRERRLTATAIHEDTPRWSPDGRRIAYARKVQSVSQIFVMNVDGSGVRQLTTSAQPSIEPAWSPDGTRIAFARGREWSNARDGVDIGAPEGRPEPAPGVAAAEIYVMDADGDGETRLTDNSVIDISPSWSPDGSLIAFTSDRSGSGAQQIYVMRPDGTNQRKLTDYPIDYHNELRPSWSPDGSTIAFVADRDPPAGNREIYTVGADGLNLQRVTWNYIYDDSPTWSPDGRLAIVRGTTEFRPEVFVVTPDGSLARKITGKNLRFIRLARFPNQPRAAQRFALELTVRPAADPFTDLECVATIGDQLLPETPARLVGGRVRCVWTLPRSARGKVLRAVIFAGAGGTEVSRTVERIVR